MKLSTIFSKTGKGLQEASGKTSHLSRADRSLLTAIDGKLSVAELAQRVGKPADAKFQQLVQKLDDDGFIREVAPAPSAVSAPRPPNVITPGYFPLALGRKKTPRRHPSLIGIRSTSGDK